MRKSFYDIVVPVVRGRMVLDVGSIGHSYADRTSYKRWNFEVLAEAAAKIKGFDILEDDVRAARDDGYDIEVGDAETYRSSEQYEVVFAGDLIEHLSNPGRFLDCSFDNLIPGGVLVLCTPNTYSFAKLARVALRATNEPPVNPEHTCYYTPQTLRHLVARHGFSIETIEYCDLEYASGHGTLAKRAQLAVNEGLSRLAPKFSQTMVAVCRKRA